MKLFVSAALLFATTFQLMGCSAPPSSQPKTNPGVVDQEPIALTLNPITGGNYVNTVNVSEFIFSGTCSLDGDVITINSSRFASPETVTCASGVWSKTFDFSSYTEGLFRVYFRASREGGSQSDQLSVMLTKDTLPPADPIVQINEGATLTNLAMVRVNLSGGAAAKMSLSEGQCDTGSKINFVTPANYTLTQLNNSTSVWVTYFDFAGNPSNCISASITHDNIAPSLAFSSPSAGTPIPVQQVAGFAVSGTCSEHGREVNFSGDVSGSSNCDGGTWNHTFDLSALPDGEVRIGIAQTDLAGNSSLPLLRSFSKSTAAPLLTLTSPTEGSYINAATASAIAFAGTCDAEGQQVVLSGAVARQWTCQSGAFAGTVDFSGVADGNLSLTLNLTNQFGASATPIHLSLQKDTAPPASSILAINSGDAFTKVLGVTLHLSAPEASNIFVSDSVLCNTGVWEAMAPTRSWTLTSENSLNTVYVKFKDLAGNETACLSDSIVHDSIAPTVAWASPAESALVNSVNQNTFTLAGTCSEEGRSVSISGAGSASANCVSGAWTTQINLSAAAEGSLELFLSHQDAATNAVSGVRRQFFKDSVGPTGGAVTIDGGLSYTDQSVVMLGLSSVGAQQMYITSEPGCVDGGVWETFAATKAFTLPLDNAENAVYVSYRDENENRSTCVDASIVHDTQPPIWGGNPTHASIYGSLSQSPFVSYVASATDEGSGVARYQYAIGTGTSDAQLNDIVDWTDVSDTVFNAIGMSLLDGQTYFVNMRATDNLGYSTVVSSAGWLVDVTAPVLTITSPASNAITTQAEVAFAGTCEVGIPVVLSLGAGVSGPASVDCVSGLFKTYVEFIGGTGARTLTASQEDLAANKTEVSVTISRFLKRPELNGTVLALQSMPDGSYFVGGSFNAFSSSKEKYFVKIDTNGERQNVGLGDAFNGIVYTALELSDGSTIVGGSFTQYRGRTANRIAKINSDGSLDMNFNPATGANGFDGTVLNMTLVGTQLYVVGSFTKYKGLTANRIAKIATDGTRDSAFSPATNGFNSTARWIHSTAVGLFVGGDFTTYKGVSARYLAKIDESGNLDTVFNPASGANGMGALVRGISSDATHLYVVGDFTTYRGGLANRIAKISLSDFSLDLTFNPATGSNGLSGSGYAIQIVGSEVLVGGAFSTYRGAAANNIVKISSSTGAIVSAFSTGGTIGVNSTVTALWSQGSSVYIAGSFTTARGSPAFRVAKLSLTNGAVDTTFSGPSSLNGANSTPNVIAASASGLWVGGAFTNYRSGTAVYNIAKFNADGTLNEEFSVQGGLQNFNAPVRAFALSSDGSELYVGGDFTSYRGSPANRIAKLDTTTGDLDLVFSPASGANGFNTGSVFALALANDTDLFVGGSFGTYRGALTNKIAKLNELGVLDLTFNPSTTANNGVSSSTSIVYAIAIDGASVYIGGTFTKYRNVTINRIAKVNFAGVLDTQFNPTATNAGFGSTVNSLYLDNNHIYVGGAFTTYRGVTVNRLARLEKVQGVLDTTFSGTGASSTVNAIVGDGNDIYIGGAFTSWKGGAANYVTKISKTSGAKDLVFSPNSGANGVNTTVNALMLDGSSVRIGGAFSSYRGLMQYYLMKTDATGAIYYE